MIRRLLILPFVIGGVLLSAGLANAGGWAVTQLDSALPEFTAGEEYVAGFTVLQHGVTPRWTEQVGLRFTSADDGTTIVFPAEPTGEVGHFDALVVLARAGVWDVEVDQGFLPDFPLHLAPHPLGSVDVVCPEKVAASAPLGSVDVGPPGFDARPTLPVPDTLTDSGRGNWVVVATVGMAAGTGLLLVWLGVLPGTLRRRTVYKKAQPTPEAAWTTKN